MLIMLKSKCGMLETTWAPGKSYLFDKEDPQKLLTKYSSKGKMVKTVTGKRTNKEVVQIDHEIGIDYNSGEKTNIVKIHYSKSRTHIVPYSDRKK